jgi:hypothetical protein
MIKVKFGNVRDQMFMAAMSKLAHSPTFKDPKAAYNIARIIAKLGQQTDTTNELFVKLLKQYAKLDEKGNFIPVENRPGTFQIPDERSEEWNTKLKEFEAIEFDIDRYAIKLDDIADAKLTPAELNAIHDILDVDGEGQPAAPKGLPAPTPFKKAAKK